MKIAFFGDSVTEGCFEIIRIDGKPEVLRDYPNCYRVKLAEKIKENYPNRDFEFLNFAYSGRNTNDAIEILLDLIKAKPDLVIMCFGLNDISGGIDLFENNLNFIFKNLKKESINVIFMTHNMFNKYVNNEEVEELIDMAKNCAELQNNGTVDKFVEVERKTAQKYGYEVADAYSKWKEFESYGIDTSLLLCNYINHPTRKMHNLFVDLLFEKIKKIIK